MLGGNLGSLLYGDVSVMYCVLCCSRGGGGGGDVSVMYCVLCCSRGGGGEGGGGGNLG